MAQYALPIADVVASNWAEGAGDSDGSAFDELDEGCGVGRGSGSGPDDATSYWLTTDEGVNDLRCDIQVITDPAVSTGHLVRVRVRKNTSGGRQLDLTYNLRDPDLIVSENFSTNIPNIWQTHSFVLTGAEADSIDGYATLDIQVQIIETGGGTPRVGWCSAMEFECPDTPGGGGGFAHSQGVFVG